MTETRTRLTAAVIQNNASAELSRNIETLERLILDAADKGADLIATAEYCSHYGMVDGRLDVGSAPLDDHPGLEAFRRIARKAGRLILLGSIGKAASDGRTLNCSVLLGPDGAIIADYDKIHLFDVDLAGGESYRESADIAPGDRAVVAGLPGLDATIGMSICYDVRFPHLYRDLARAGADILTIPAAFTARTGRAHWHTLVRARAIETGAFVIAPAQCGANEEGRLKRYGHALIVAPWGEILADAGEDEGMAMAELDLTEVGKARRMIPALQHDRPYRPADAAMSSAAE